MRHIFDAVCLYPPPPLPRCAWAAPVDGLGAAQALEAEAARGECRRLEAELAEEHRCGAALAAEGAALEDLVRAAAAEAAEAQEACAALRAVGPPGRPAAGRPGEAGEAGERPGDGVEVVRLQLRVAELQGINGQLRAELQECRIQRPIGSLMPGCAVSVCVRASMCVW